MMLGWLVYLTAIGAVLGLAGLLAERGLHHLGAPARHVWAGVLGATSLVGLAGAAAWVTAAVGAASVATAADAFLLLAWSGASVVMLVGIRVSAWTVRRNARSWPAAEVEGARVVVSTGIGPGVVGATRPRIVLPRWVLGSEPGLRRLIVRHELEHVRAGDPMLLQAGLVLAALVPWCVPVWWQLHRLREAIETDCDARVLTARTPVRDYAGVLVTVAGRGSDDLSPVLSLAPNVRSLERRIRRVTAGPTRRSRWVGWRYLAAAALSVSALSAVPVPAAPVAEVGSTGAEPVGVGEREATIIFSIPR